MGTIICGTGVFMEHSHAQSVGDAAAGLGVSPPSGYVARPGVPQSPSESAIRLSRTDEEGTGCSVSFEALPGFDQFTQDALNRQTDHADWQRFYREGLGDFYSVASVASFDHAGVNGAVIVGVSRNRPAAQDWIADRPALIFMFYTPKGLTKIICVASAAVFAARRAEFEAVARGITLPR